MQDSTDEQSIEYHLSRLLKLVPAPHVIWRAAEAAALMPLQFSEPLLDLGCGDGLFSQLIFGQQVAVGLDLSEDQSRAALHRGTYRLAIAGQGESLPFRSGSFSTVFSNCVLEHIPRLSPVLAEVSRVLAPGGIFIFTVPSQYFSRYLFHARLLEACGWQQGAKKAADIINAMFRHHHLYGPDTWQEQLEENGLELVETKYIVPQLAEALWSLLLPLGALQLWLKNHLAHWNYPLQRWSLPLWRWLFARVLSRPCPVGGGLLVVGRKGKR